MAVIGNAAATNFQTIRKQTITGTGATAYALDYSVSGPNDLEVFVNNVRQEPTAAYTASGQTITFSDAVDSSDSVYIVYQGQTVGSVIHPADQPLRATNATFSGTVYSDNVLAKSGAATAQINGYTPSASNMAGRNRIINGDMRIDQRNAGASVTPANADFIVDRFQYFASQASKVTSQQNAGSVTPPIGFTKYLGVTSSSAYSVGATDFFTLSHKIEGFNTADLGWGTANAATVTLSFWVRSSLTGTFGGTVFNNAQNRYYLFSYAINAANTWEQKTITIVGDTSGTWATDNSIGMRIMFGLGVGSTYSSGTTGSWGGTLYYSVTGATSVVGTSGATFYITGVQLEVGSTASEFEHRQYGQELALCQRYYETTYDIGIAPGSSTYLGVNTNGGLTNMAAANYATRGGSTFKVTKRAQPTITTYDTAGNAGKCNYPDTATNQSFTVIHRGFQGFTAETSTLSAGTDTRCYWHFVASAEL